MVDYEELNASLEAMVAGVRHFIANLANSAALLYETLPELNWAGFYLMEDGRLVLGPFVGRPACVEIEIGCGVCGSAVASGEILTVPDVHLFPGHIPCDGASNSEIVLPIRRGGEIVGVLDIDSPKKDRFQSEDAEGLARFVSVLERTVFA